jgi:hypothetical protein
MRNLLDQPVKIVALLIGAAVASVFTLDVVAWLLTESLTQVVVALAACWYAWKHQHALASSLKKLKNLI